MEKLHELHYKDGAGTVNIKNVKKTLPSYRVRTIEGSYIVKEEVDLNGK